MSVEVLSKLKPAFSKDGSTHAGNASQVSDGAAAVLLARRSVAKKLGLPILGKFVTASVVGVPRESPPLGPPHGLARELTRARCPRITAKIMGIGPAFAIPKALEKAGITQEEVDFFEM